MDAIELIISILIAFMFGCLFYVVINFTHFLGCIVITFLVGVGLGALLVLHEGA